MDISCSQHGHAVVGGSNVRIDPVVVTDFKMLAHSARNLNHHRLGFSVFTGIDHHTLRLGFFLVILLPMILFFVYQAIRVVMNVIAYNKEKAAEEAAAAVANSDLTEEQKQRAIEEYLAKQKAQESETAVQTPADGGSSDAES